MVKYLKNFNVISRERMIKSSLVIIHSPIHLAYFSHSHICFNSLGLDERFV